MHISQTRRAVKTLQIRTIAPTSACVVKKRSVGSESTLPSLDSLQSLTPRLGQKKSKACKEENIRSVSVSVAG